LEVDAGFTVLAKGDVGGVEGAGRANGYAFFACGDLVVLVASFLCTRIDLYHVET
jgi:hypothetical protein